MYHSGKQSLIIRSGMTLAVLVFISVLTMLITFLTAESAENDAVRINLAGSLRMQSYRIAENLILNHSDLVADKIPMAELVAEFERRFYQPVLANYVRSSGDGAIRDFFSQLETQWLTIKTDVLRTDVDVAMMLAQIDHFVVALDQLVKKLEQQTENKLKLLRTLQGISMFVTVIVVVLFLFDLVSTMLAPLRQLVTMANKMRDGDFSMRINVGRDDELALLSDTLNMTASSLDAMYRDLEHKIKQKTSHLEQARDELGLLYETSRQLSGGGKISQRLDLALASVQRYFSALQTRVELFSPDSEATLAQVVSPANHVGDDSGLSAGYQHRYTIERQGQQQGELIVTTVSPGLDLGQQRTLRLVADNIAAALSAESQRGQQHRLVLMEERAVIARELHDSLAQNLSYLKIQISRFQILQAKGASPQQLDATVDQVKQGINAAYVQLRELLSTFRLQLSSEGLNAALEATVTEFTDRAAIEIELDYRLGDIPLTANEEIHVLQIVREALSNVLRHSRAQHAYIAAFVRDDQAIEVSISDDGQGFAAVDSSDNQYGKTIMRERAHTLKGKIGFDNIPRGGAIVVLSFVPEVIAPTAVAAK